MGCKSSTPKGPVPDFQSNLIRKASFDEFEKIYEEGKVLGAGITGSVKTVTHRKTGEIYAMKSINLARINKAQLKELRNEIRILRQLDHPNIVRLYETFEDKKAIYLIMELCTGGEVTVKGLTRESQVVAVLAQLLAAIRYCHERGVVHRDLKLENIIFADDDPKSFDIKLIDFGLSATFSGLTSGGGSSSARQRKLEQAKRMFLTTCGTAYYMAPEVVKGSYSEASHHIHVKTTHDILFCRTLLRTHTLYLTAVREILDLRCVSPGL